MKLKDVKHVEMFCGEKMVEDFSFWNNRFELFDKLERNLNSFSMEKLENVLELNVLETKEGGYSGYGVGFPVTHIKLDFCDDTKLSYFPKKFGGMDRSL